MPGRVVYFNGTFIPEHEARVSLFDSGLMYGDMAFEMTRTFNQQPFRLWEHLERLYGSMAILEIDCGLTIDEMEQATLETLARNLESEDSDVDWHIRHDVSPGPLELYASTFPEGIRPTVIISCWPLIKHMGRFAANYDAGVHVVTSTQRAIPANILDPHAKTRSRVHFQLAQVHARRLGKNAWPVLLDPDGFFTEGPSWNIFLVEGGTLLTPEPRNVLHGVSRAITMDAAANLGIPVREMNIERAHALHADEMFCTATSFGLVHAAHFDGQPVNGGQPGPVFQQLMTAWKDAVGLDFVAQAKSYTPRIAAWEARELEAARNR